MPPKADTGSQRSALLVGLQQGLAFRDAAGIGVLDDDDRRGSIRIELGDAFIGCVGVVDIVVGKLLSLRLPGRRDAGALLGRAVEGGPLVRVFAVAHRLRQNPAEGPIGRRLFADLGRKPIRDRGVVGRRAGIGLLRQSAPQGQRQRAAVGVKIGENRAVIGAVDHHRDIAMVLGGGADHGRAADVDVLDAVLVNLSCRDGGLERVEVDDQKIDRRDAVGQHGRLMLRVRPHPQKAAVNGRMQRLDAPVHHLREAGEVGDLLHGQARVGERLMRAAGRDEGDPALAQRARERDKSGLVGYGQKGARHGLQIARHPAAPLGRQAPAVA